MRREDRDEERVKKVQALTCPCCRLFWPEKTKLQQHLTRMLALIASRLTRENDMKAA